MSVGTVAATFDWSGEEIRVDVARELARMEAHALRRSLADGCRIGDGSRMIAARRAER